MRCDANYGSLPEQLLVSAAFTTAAVAQVPRGDGKAVLNR